MKVLLQGHESEKLVNLYLSFTNIKTDSDTAKALRLHLSVGATDTAASSTYGINKSNFSRALLSLQSAAKTVEQIKIEQAAEKERQKKRSNSYHLTDLDRSKQV